MSEECPLPCSGFLVRISDDEISKLQTRLKDQANLISLLRERAERESKSANYIPVNTIESPQEADSLRIELAQERDLTVTLSQRFDELNGKFTEMVEMNSELETTLRQKLDRHHAAMRPIIDAKDDEIIKLQDQVRLLEREKSEAVAQVTVKEYDFERQTADSTSTLHEVRVRLQRTVTELKAEKLTRNHFEESLLSLREELANLQEEVERRLHKTAALHDVIAERGERLCEKDQLVNQLTEKVDEWREKVGEVTGKFHARTAEVDVDARVRSLSDEVVRLQRKLELADRQQMAVKSVSAAALANERERSSVLRGAKSISDLIQLQNKIQQQCAVGCVTSKRHN